ncbi:hypothetical protein FGG08_001110 [Glutinoglossum americanum]|uniref:Uncharacterized protein n=1 Tax=Glutinoglossum americanum TaxID=1670608 RepID=A0A9P8IC34_9PEZI|nr:hypothetical protein FGG08_001110 [Glutinoglossum americanum]
MSEDGSLASIGLGSRIDIYHFHSPWPSRWKLKELSDLESQKLSFSQDQNRRMLIIARRATTGKVTMEIYDLRGTRIWSISMNRNEYLGGGDDFGLSSVLHNGATGIAVVTAFTSIPYEIFHSTITGLNLQPQGWNIQVFRLQGAAQSPSGKYIVLVDATYMLFRLDTDSNRVEKGMRLSRRRLSASSGDDLMAIAMPNENTIHTFWVEGGKMVLTTITWNGRDTRLERRIIPDIDYRMAGPPDEGSVREAEGSVHEAEGSVHEAVGSVHEAVGSVHEAVGSVHEAEGELASVEMEATSLSELGAYA